MLRYPFLFLFPVINDQKYKKQKKKTIHVINNIHLVSYKQIKQWNLQYF